MNTVAFRPEVLKLNKARMPIDLDTPEKVFGDLLTWKAHGRFGDYILDDKGNRQRKMLAFDIIFEELADGNYDFDNVIDIQLLDGDQWMALKPRSYDIVLNTPRQIVRIPRVVMVLEYNKMPERKFSKSYNSVYDLYNGVCQYTNRKLKRHEGNRDHVIPLSKGGADDISNIVLSDIKVNNNKGGRYNHECGLPDVKPKIPKGRPKLLELQAINRARKIPEWRYFLGE